MNHFKMKLLGSCGNDWLKKQAIIALAALVTICILGNAVEVPLTRIIASIYQSLQSEPQITRIMLDDMGIPIVDYGYQDGIDIGEQRNPVTICQKALAYYDAFEFKDDEVSRQYFLNCADWLVNNMVVYGDYAVLEYWFDYSYGMSAPWRSGMAQGEALQVLCKAHNITGEEKYLGAAKKLLNIFYLQIAENGVTDKTLAKGWWYEEYADEGGVESKVLNGMIFAVLGIYEYQQYTNDPDAEYLFDQGVLSLRMNIANYDMDGYSYYDIVGIPADKSYRLLHIRLLDYLCEITGDEYLKQYHDKWAQYEARPLLVRWLQHPDKLGAVVLFVGFLIIALILEVLMLIIVKFKKKRS